MVKDGQRQIAGTGLSYDVDLEAFQDTKPTWSLENKFPVSDTTPLLLSPRILATASHSERILPPSQSHQLLRPRCGPTPIVQTQRITSLNDEHNLARPPPNPLPVLPTPHRRTPHRLGKTHRPPLPHATRPHPRRALLHDPGLGRAGAQNHQRDDTNAIAGDRPLRPLRGPADVHATLPQEAEYPAEAILAAVREGILSQRIVEYDRSVGPDGGQEEVADLDAAGVREVACWTGR